MRRLVRQGTAVDFWGSAPTSTVHGMAREERARSPYTQVLRCRCEACAVVSSGPVSRVGALAGLVPQRRRRRVGVEMECDRGRQDGAIRGPRPARRGADNLPPQAGPNQKEPRPLLFELGARLASSHFPPLFASPLLLLLVRLRPVVAVNRSPVFEPGFPAAVHLHLVSESVPERMRFSSWLLSFFVVFWFSHPPACLSCQLRRRLARHCARCVGACALAGARGPI